MLEAIIMVLPLDMVRCHHIRAKFTKESGLKATNMAKANGGVHLGKDMLESGNREGLRGSVFSRIKMEIDILETSWQDSNMVLASKSSRMEKALKVVLNKECL